MKLARPHDLHSQYDSLGAAGPALAARARRAPLQPRSHRGAEATHRLRAALAGHTLRPARPTSVAARGWNAMRRFVVGAPPAKRTPVAAEPHDTELPDVTGILVLLLVTFGLFVVPVGATLLQGPAILAGLLSGG